MTTRTLQAPFLRPVRISFPLPGLFSWRLREVFHRRHRFLAGYGSDDALQDHRASLLVNQPPV